jgi:hypothetical protein
VGWRTGKLEIRQKLNQPIKKTIMKKLFFLLGLLLVLATSCATQKSSPTALLPTARGEVLPSEYLSGNNEAVAMNCWIAPPDYLTGNDEPVADGVFVNEQ